LHGAPEPVHVPALPTQEMAVRFGIRERMKAGLTAARVRGRQGGRPKGLSKEALSKAQAAKTLYLQQDKTVAEIGQLLGVGRATIYRWPT